MRAAVITFPGSNCDRDLAVAMEAVFGQPVRRVWHQETELPPLDLIGVPGGFAYGDYLRCGAIAARSPVMREVARRAREGVAVLGVCNGFQVLAEAGVLPGALIRNAQLRFVCRYVDLEVVTSDSAFTRGFAKGVGVRLPVAHHALLLSANPATAQSATPERVLTTASTPVQRKVWGFCAGRSRRTSRNDWSVRLGQARARC